MNQNELDMAMSRSDGPSIIPLIFMGIIAIFMIASMWKMFTKAGQPGWACIIPIYNLVVLCRIAGKPGWWVVLCLIPLVNYVVLLLMWLGVAQNFGKGAGFGVGLWLLGPVFIPILAFGEAQYQGSPA